MIRKFTLALMLCCILMSCGKKGDPEYKDSKKEEIIPTITINKA